MFLVEIGNSSFGVLDICHWFPRVFGFRISFPFDQVFKLPSNHLHVEDCFDFVFVFFINHDRGRFRETAVGYYRGGFRRS